VKRNWLLRIGIALTVLVLILSFTPLDWFVEKWLWGVPDEYYPELAWLIFGLPAALLVLIAGVFSAWSARRGMREPANPLGNH
jgi:O-antigen/teichoic acid export membrane protein